MKTKSKISAFILRGSATVLLVSCSVVVLCAAINLPGHLPKFAAPPNQSAFGDNGHKIDLSAAAPATRRNRMLTFADRVAYQRAIEEIYWRHRIWPRANAGPKPPLDEVMSQAQIDKKVKDYLRNSQALEDYWQKSITPDQLQAEMERMASHTNQPEVLREIFAALGNDPFVIAECLARSVLTERLLTELYAHDQRFHGELKRRAEAEPRRHRSSSEIKQTRGVYTEMEWIKKNSTEEDSAPGETPNAVAAKMNNGEWEQSVARLAAQFGSEEIVGQALRLPNGGLAAGAAALQKPPIAQIKTGSLSSLQEDDARYYATAILNKGKDHLKLATIGSSKEPLRSWLARAEAQLPITMAAVSANYTLPVIASPSAACIDDTWTAMSTTNAPAGREYHTAVWTGSEMIVWGGFNGSSYFNTGGRYNPSTDSWAATSTANAPVGRSSHTAVWTGKHMIVWGGSSAFPNYFNTGGKYNPNTDSWTVISTNIAPTARRDHTAVWTGSHMIVWGGFGLSGNLNTGGRYDPNTDNWAAISTTNAPAARYGATSVWDDLDNIDIVWGGTNGSSFLNTGGRYNPGTDTWGIISTITAPAGRNNHTAVWSGSQMIVWGGFDGAVPLNTGGRYNPGNNTWSPTSLIGAPAARLQLTAVWMGFEMIVWGGTDGFNSLNTGGRYNPSNDTWTVTNTTGAPAARELHSAIGAGSTSQMIVWGGASIATYFITGGRYCVGKAPTPTPTPTTTATPTATASPIPTASSSPSVSPTATAASTPTPSPVTGCCQLPGGTCVSGITRNECNAQHGFYWIADGDCLPGYCHLPPLGCCQISDGNCESGLSQAECSRRDGIYWVENGACRNGICASRPRPRPTPRPRP